MSYNCKGCGAVVTDDIVNEPKYKCWQCGGQFSKADISNWQKSELSSSRCVYIFIGFIFFFPLVPAIYYYHKKCSTAKLQSLNINKRKIAYEAFLLSSGFLFLLGIFAIFTEPLMAIILVLIGISILIIFRRTKRKRENSI